MEKQKTDFLPGFWIVENICIFTYFFKLDLFYLQLLFVYVGGVSAQSLHNNFACSDATKV